jgi:hypothetical protein
MSEIEMLEKIRTYLIETVDIILDEIWDVNHQIDVLKSIELEHDLIKAELLARMDS